VERFAEEGATMSDTNHVIEIGRLARDAEMKYLPSGTAVLNFSIAVGRSIPPKEGSSEWKTETSFFDCVCFGKTAEHKAKMMTKGRQVAIDGELRQEKWEADGHMHYRIKIIAQSIQILALPKGQTESEGAPAGSAPGADDFKDEIPF
jgi:single-strand DNA-binding protein